jgi:cell division protein FtsB
MEEGPEPQELMERVEESLHEQHSAGQEGHKSEAKHGSKHMKSAITAAVLAVMAAIGSLLSGHAANEAILLQTKASNQWSYFQAKSTKLHLYEANRSLIQAIMHMSPRNDKESGAPKGDTDQLAKLTAQAEAKMKGYEKEKAEIQEKATDLEKESAVEFGAHQMYSFAVACFQIGIVLASVSILVESTLLYSLSITSGAAGVVLIVMGYIHWPQTGL